MTNSFQKIVTALLITTSLIACNKDDSKNGGGDLRPLNVTPTNISGAWEIDAQISNGQSHAPAAKWQFEISETTITAIESRNNQVVWNRSAEYVLQNTRLVTQNADKNILPDMEIVTITASTMQVRPIFPQDTSNQNLTWNLRRIDPSELVGGSTKPGDPDDDHGSWGEQSIQMQMITPTQQYTYKNSFSGRGQRQQRSPLSCSYDRESGTFELELNAYRRGTEDREERNLEAQLTLIGRDVRFSFSERSETVNFSIVNPRRQQSPLFVATYNPPGARKVYFGMTRDSRCNVTLNRQGRSVFFEGMCRDLDANGDRIEGRARVSLKGSCALFRERDRE